MKVLLCAGFWNFHRLACALGGHQGNSVPLRHPFISTLLRSPGIRWLPLHFCLHRASHKLCRCFPSLKQACAYVCLDYARQTILSSVTIEGSSTSAKKTSPKENIPRKNNVNIATRPGIYIGCYPQNSPLTKKQLVLQ